MKKHTGANWSAFDFENSSKQEIIEYFESAIYYAKHDYPKTFEKFSTIDVMIGETLTQMPIEIDSDDKNFFGMANKIYDLFIESGFKATGIETYFYSEDYKYQFQWNNEPIGNLVFRLWYDEAAMKSILERRNYDLEKSRDETISSWYAEGRYMGD